MADANVKERKMKVTVIGDTEVGKTSILLRFAEGDFNLSFISTIGVDYKHKSIDVGFPAERVKLQIWDTAGQERFRNVTPVYFRGSDGVMLVFDVTSTSSFDSVRGWMASIEANVDRSGVQKILVGNKCDKDDRVVSVEEAMKLAAEFGIPYVDTSAKMDINIEQAFVELATNIKNSQDKNAESEADTGKSTVNLIPPRANDSADDAKKGCC